MEKQLAIARAWIVVVMLVFGTTLTPSRGALAQSNSDVAAAAVQATKYYDALAKGQYAEVWELLSDQRRYDTPRADYIDGVNSVVKAVIVIQKPKLLTSKGPDGRRVVGFAADIAIIAKDGAKTAIKHETLWEPQLRSGKETWVLTGERSVESGLPGKTTS